MASFNTDTDDEQPELSWMYPVGLHVSEAFNAPIVNSVMMACKPAVTFTQLSPPNKVLKFRGCRGAAMELSHWTGKTTLLHCISMSVRKRTWPEHCSLLPRVR